MNRKNNFNDATKLVVYDISFFINILRNYCSCIMVFFDSEQSLHKLIYCISYSSIIYIFGIEYFVSTYTKKKSGKKFR